MRDRAEIAALKENALMLRDRGLSYKEIAYELKIANELAYYYAKVRPHRIAKCHIGDKIRCVEFAGTVISSDNGNQYQNCYLVEIDPYSCSREFYRKRNGVSVIGKKEAVLLERAKK